MEEEDSPWAPNNFEEMKSKMPAYFFMNFKQKKKYFKKLTTKYMKTYRNNIKPGKRRLNFNMGNVSVKSKYPILIKSDVKIGFFKNASVSKKPVESTSPAPKVLK